MSSTRPARHTGAPAQDTPRPLTAAGAVLWRRRRQKLEVALIHRPRYDDWSWPKGKLDPGEDSAGAAVREIEEETGFTARLGIPLPRSLYALPRGDLKEVRYWAASITGGDGVLRHEVDKVAWLSPNAARRRLTHPRDRLQLQAVLDADARGTLDTWPLLVVRHASSLSRSKWEADDWLRPLDDAGRARATHVVSVLAAYGTERIVSSPSTRCVETMEPFVRAYPVRIDTKNGLSEEGFAARPEKAVKHTDRALRRAVPAALCTHRPLLPNVLEHLAGRAAPLAATKLREVLEDPMDKGEVLVCQIAGAGEDARVVSLERHRP